MMLAQIVVAKAFSMFFRQKIIPYRAKNLRFGNAKIVHKGLHKTFRMRRILENITNQKIIFHIAILQKV